MGAAGNTYGNSAVRGKEKSKMKDISDLKNATKEALGILSPSKSMIEACEGVKTWQGMSLETAHRTMWRWLAENPIRGKYGWFITFYPDAAETDLPLSGCFACEACGGVCKNSPLDEEIIGCYNGGLYKELCLTEDLNKRAELAREIAELPWNEVDK